MIRISPNYIDGGPTASNKILNVTIRVRKPIMNRETSTAVKKIGK